MKLGTFFNMSPETIYHVIAACKHGFIAETLSMTMKRVISYKIKQIVV